MRELTNAEEDIMRVLWRLKKAFVKDILTELPALDSTGQKPAYNTVSTIIRILEKKGVVGYTAYGKTHEYYPLIQEDEYRRFQTEQLMTNYFGGSLKQLVSFFVKDRNLSLNEADEIIDLLNRRKP
ncbi:transcriptional repressor, CopY family [Fibrella aestuarina BUZ 2]|uniref:Transcriptional repressor, CopY family n=1 Tax=Fibrella aestuarina BUZ 2 TaxID=1166018 RepID=I0KA87_9BACT|nr:BlaI/MecI/CopY family transcriptional regulator [Fibrella aestuarina]CCH01040.1 transcriptional repressor, CopY family [Fibrella aestuarina BUZ 2]